MTTTDRTPHRPLDRAVPPPGPLDLAPIVSRQIAGSMMDTVLGPIDLGLFDLYVLRVIRRMDPFQVATVASLLARAYAAGEEEAHRARASAIVTAVPSSPCPA